MDCPSCPKQARCERICPQFRKELREDIERDRVITEAYAIVKKIERMEGEEWGGGLTRRNT